MAPFGYMFPPGTTTVNQLSDWITLDLSAADHVEEDGGMTENTSTDSTGTTITTPGGTGGYVAWIFEPVDANGDSIDLSENSLIFEFDWVTQPADGNDGGLFAGMTASPVLSAVLLMVSALYQYHRHYGIPRHLDLNQCSVVQ